jgi:hypothetical protein
MSVAVACAMWVTGCLCVGLAYALSMRDAERASPSGAGAGATAVLIAGGLIVLASGPVAYVIGRRRLLLGLPLVAAGLWGAGIAIAYAT